MSAVENKAVFLSYASQDADAARRIAEALRAAGVEVWFDQNELVGGDAWDAKIRGQISSCALFLPVISASTQARREGYFRIEWKLAAQRTHAMADGTPFLLPIVIDATRDSDALVPAEFKAVQWTRLTGVEGFGAFSARVAALLNGRQMPEGSEHTPPVAGNASSAVHRPPSVAWKWVGAAIGIFALAVALVLWRPWSGGGEAARLTQQARDLIYDPDSARGEFALAESQIKRATELVPDAARAWGVSAVVHSYMYTRGYDFDKARLGRAQGDAEKALRLDAREPDALFVLGLLRWTAGDRARAEDYWQKARAVDPENPRLERFFALLNPDDNARAAHMLQAAARQPKAVEHLYYAALYLISAGRYAEASATLDRAEALHPFWRMWVMRADIEGLANGDPVRMLAWLDRVPDLKRNEPRVAVLRWKAAMLQRDGAAAVQALEAIPVSFFSDNFFNGPKAFLEAQAYELAGEAASARDQWRVAEQALRARYLEEPNRPEWATELAIALTGLSRDAEAREIVAHYHEAERLAQGSAAQSAASSLGRLGFDNEFIAQVHLRLGEPDTAMRILERMQRAKVGERLTPAELRTQPRWDSLRERADFKALAGTAAAGTPPEATSGPPEKSVAVLAFSNLSDDKANEYFSDGVSEELINVLAKVPGLKVTARTSAFSFKGKNVPIPEIARQLGVAYVVDGSVRKSGDKVRIAAQLIKAADGFQVWGDAFPRDLKDVFAVQDEIAGLVAKNISPLLASAKPAASRAVNPEAFQAYLAGRALAAKAGLDNLREAVAQFARAVQLDPGYTAASVQQARAYVQLGRWAGMVPKQAWAAAKAALAPALAAEPDSPDVLVAQGWILRTADWRWRDAERAFRRAVELRPNDPDVLTSAAVLLLNIGKNDEADKLVQRALEIDPLNPSTQLDLGMIYRFSGRMPEAERQFRRALELAPHGQRYHAYLAFTLVRLNRIDEAETMARAEPDELARDVALGFAAAARHDDRALRELFRRIEARRPTMGQLADYNAYVAGLYAATGDLNVGLAELALAREAHDPSIPWIKVNSLLAPLAAHPDWPAFLRSVGLADEQLK